MSNQVRTITIEFWSDSPRESVEKMIKNELDTVYSEQQSQPTPEVTTKPIPCLSLSSFR